MEAVLFCFAKSLMLKARFDAGLKITDREKHNSPVAFFYIDTISESLNGKFGLV